MCNNSIEINDDLEDSTINAMGTTFTNHKNAVICGAHRDDGYIDPFCVWIVGSDKGLNYRLLMPNRTRASLVKLNGIFVVISLISCNSYVL